MQDLFELKIKTKYILTIIDQYNIISMKNKDSFADEDVFK